MVTTCLESLSQQTLSKADFDILLVENEAHEQDTAPHVPTDLDFTRVLLSGNLGTTGSVNHALTLSDSEYVLLLNNDVELERSCLQALLATLQNDLRAGFATPKLLRATDRTILDGAGDALLLGGGAYRLGHGDADSEQFNVPRNVLAGCGAATMYRRAAIAEAGGLDEDFFAYLDDLDLSLRAQLMGWTGAYAPSAVAYHIGSATLGNAMHPRVIRWMTRNQLLLLTKNCPSPLLLRLVPRILIFQLLWLALAVKRGALLTYLEGIIDFLRLLPRMFRKRRVLMGRSKLDSDSFLRLLRSSESQIAAWHFSRHAKDRSKLLDTYFRMFRIPPAPGSP